MIPPSANSVVILLFVNEGILYLIALFKKKKNFHPGKAGFVRICLKKIPAGFPVW
jgi:hypothetical protein